MPKPHPLFEKPDPPGSREIRKIVIIGQAPSRRGAEANRAAIGGPTGLRVASLLGMDVRGYVRTFRRLNLVQDHPGKAGRGDAFPKQEAKASWEKLLPNLAGRRVVLLGSKVADVVIGRDRWCWCDPRPIEYVIPRLTFDCMVLPHPSGLNHYWNEPALVELARKILREFVHARS